MEVCSIIPNQRYSYKLDPNQTSKMIKHSSTRPKERLEAIRAGCQMLNWNDDPYLNRYGIKVDNNPTLVSQFNILYGRILMNLDQCSSSSKS